VEHFGLLWPIEIVVGQRQFARFSAAIHLDWRQIANARIERLVRG
jgi:hypothetical protein